MRPIGHDGYHPTSVAEWLDSIELGDYTKAFLINGYTSMDLLKKIWEVELINVSWSVNDTLSTLDDSYHRWVIVSFFIAGHPARIYGYAFCFEYMSLLILVKLHSHSLLKFWSGGLRGLSGCFTLFQETSQAALGLPF